MDSVDRTLGDFDATATLKLLNQVVQIARACDTEVDIAAGPVRAEAAHGLTADHEPVRQVSHGAADWQRHDIDRCAWTLHLDSPSPQDGLDQPAAPGPVSRHARGLIQGQPRQAGSEAGRGQVAVVETVERQLVCRHVGVVGQVV